MSKIKFAPLDGSLTNFGIAKLIYDTETGERAADDLKLVKAEKSKVESIRVSSDRLRRSKRSQIRSGATSMTPLLSSPRSRPARNRQTPPSPSASWLASMRRSSRRSSR